VTRRRFSQTHDSVPSRAGDGDRIIDSSFPRRSRCRNNGISSSGERGDVKDIPTAAGGGRLLSCRFDDSRVVSLVVSPGFVHTTFVVGKYACQGKDVSRKGTQGAQRNCGCTLCSLRPLAATIIPWIDLDGRYVCDSPTQSGYARGSWRWTDESRRWRSAMLLLAPVSWGVAPGWYEFTPLASPVRSMANIQFPGADYSENEISTSPVSGTAEG